MNIDENIKGIKKLEEMSEAHGAQVCTLSGKPPDPNAPSGAPQEIDPNSGMHKDYYVLCPEERAKGFVRPFRNAYIHVGERPKHPLRDLTEEEKTRYAAYGYVKFEEYHPKSDVDSVTGRFWTASQLANQRRCGMTTTMGRALSETYARDPHFYGSTFCCTCGGHFPVAEFTWEDGTVVGS
jgi:hypothetical protein